MCPWNILKRNVFLYLVELLFLDRALTLLSYTQKRLVSCIDPRLSVYVNGISHRSWAYICLALLRHN